MLPSRSGVASPTPYGSSSVRFWVHNPHQKTSIAIISGTGKAIWTMTDYKFGRYIHRVYTRTKSPLRILEKRERGVSRDYPHFWIPPITPETGKTTNFKFCTHIHMIDRNKSPLKISGKVAVGALRDSRKFSGHPYIGPAAGASRGHLSDSSAFLYLPTSYYASWWLVVFNN